MGIEIERKFLVRDDDWRGSARSRAEIRQAYLSSGERSSTRVRIKDGRQATLTVKSKRAELRRIELEFPISVPDAETLLALRESSLIDKVRHAVPCGDHEWEVDVFRGENAGLVIAEIELKDERETFARPSSLSVEVTGQQQYYNSTLAQRLIAAGSAPLRKRARALQPSPAWQGFVL
jgi:adenylate cyclase